MISKSDVKLSLSLRVPDTDDVKEKTSLFSVLGKNLLGICFMVFVLLICFTLSVSSARSKQ